MKKKKLSIIIPTKNRQYYCMKAIEQILDSTSDSTEIVIQDNSDDDSLRISIDLLKSDRITYHYHNGTISFVNNFSEALSYATGEHICIIGDDDGILSNIEHVVEYIEENNIDAFVPGLNIMYSWPSDIPFTPKAENGYLYITPITKKIRKVDSKKALDLLLKKAFQDYQGIKVPRLYHGIINRQSLEQVRLCCGHYFGGLTPDMFMSVALTLVCKNIYCSNFPITISGMCQGSGSANSATGAHTGELEDAPHFIGHINYEWDNHIPYLYTVETIWAETALHALSDMNKFELIDKVDYCYLLAIIKMKYPQFIDRVHKFAEENNIPITAINRNIHQIRIKSFLIRAGKALMFYRQRSKRIYGVLEIKDIGKFIDIKIDKKVGFKTKYKI